MKIRALFAAAALALVSGVTFAMHCPADMKAIDDALAKKPQLAAADLAEVNKLRAEGEALHKAGKHGESVEKLGRAMSILGIE